MSKLSAKIPKAVCLFSGGLDSTTCLYLVRSQNKQVIALTVDYGQLHRKEIEIAGSLCRDLAIQHHTLRLTMPWGGSSLLNACIPMPQNRAESQMTDIPSTYVPARNSILLSLACSCAEAEGADEVFIGVNALDYSGYPDCRPEFVAAFQNTVRLGTKVGVENHPIQVMTPLLRMSKKEIVLLAAKLGVPFKKTWSCYKGQEVPCGVCDSCVLRAKGFHEAGVTDPLIA